MKIFLVLTLLALAACGTSAQDLEPQDLHPCGELLRQKCPMAMGWPFLRPPMWYPSRCLEMRQECCLRIRQVEPPHRCQVVCSLVEAVVQQMLLQGSEYYELQRVAQGAKNLPAMCGVSLPSYCTTPCAITGGGACC